jgi:hypothetical protein
MIGKTVELRLVIFHARSSFTIHRFTTQDWRISPVLGARVDGLHTTPPSLVQGRGDEGSASARQGRPASARGRSRRERGLPEMWFEAVH